MTSGPLRALRASLAQQLAELRGAGAPALPDSLLDIAVRSVAVPGGEMFSVVPVDWEALRHDEAAEGRPIPYWARLWPSGVALAGAVAAEPPARGTRVLELGCGLGLPSIAAARAGACVLATDASTDAVAFAAHAMTLNEVVADVAVRDWEAHADVLEAAAPFDFVLAADVLYTRENVQTALRLLPRLIGSDGAVWLADPARAGAREFLAAARATFALDSQDREDVRLHRLRRR